MDLTTEEKLQKMADFYKKVDHDNIFKHNITARELTRFGGVDGNWEIFKECKKVPFAEKHDNCYYALGLLYSGRGDDKKASEFWSKVEDKKMLKTLWTDF